jgi:hypothetical protein
MPQNFKSSKGYYKHPQDRYDPLMEEMLLNRSNPQSVTHFRDGFLAKIMKRNDFPGYRYQSLDQNHHEKFNYQGLNYFIHSPYELVSRDSAFHQTIANHSIMVHLSPKKMLIDEALENYPPERLIGVGRLALFLILMMFQTWMLLERRKTAEILQDLYEEQLQIRVSGKQNLSNMWMRAVLHGPRNKDKSLWRSRHEVLQTCR